MVASSETLTAHCLPRVPDAARPAETGDRAGADLLLEHILRASVTQRFLFPRGATAAVQDISYIAKRMAPQRSIDWQQKPRVGAGLQNLGNTCFLNAVLQCLTYTPPLAKYLLSREHSQSCAQPHSCVMFRVQEHVNKVLCTAAPSILPLDVLVVLQRIGDHFQLGRQEDAHEFLRCTLDAMQRACLPETSRGDMFSKTTIVHQIFEGLMRSRVTCLSCGAASESFEPFLDVLLDIKGAASVTEALDNFMKPETLEAENGYRCSHCGQVVVASKACTIQRAPEVLTLGLKRFEVFTGRKITKVVKYPAFLDLGPYMSQAAGEPLLYSLYAVLVHSGASCHWGHNFCFIKASDGMWYQMDDSSVEPRGAEPALGQEAYLLFYVRCSDTKTEESVSSSPAPPAPDACSSPCQRTASSEQDSSQVEDVEASPEDSNSSTAASTSQPSQPGAQEASAGWLSHIWPGTLSITSFMGSCWHRFFCSCRRLVSRRRAVCPDCCPPPGPVLHPQQDSSNKGQPGLVPSSCSQRSRARERTRSRSPQPGSNCRSWLVAATDDEPSAARRVRTSPPHQHRARRAEGAAGPARGSSQLAPAPRAAQEPTLLGQSERSQRPGQGADLQSQPGESTACAPPAERRRRAPLPPRCPSAKRSRRCSGDAGGAALSGEVAQPLAPAVPVRQGRRNPASTRTALARA
ncbi:ubiquitin carboxyl-terminal hydrolase 17-like isoform X9 [Apus apus]|uniref:ubiquitin carboxyl-terminal hydrolase 17-like isoform X1 n=1 Tax=Apus apus TaxID=8895 RepID=UPI0021F86E1E|nr:ubiquitin carboxyl-terminal hydrolase 17-like isoform X1 [Apus apus]XP_051483427.1 ubiquitin carboxyl-terminal hydrolase 17-like isoform X2 [Apus apus]XP_051483428.1 ubiquitin carboxyl-terminal hydrolase 17-like isoform X3 [Apus apus]XP_051483430.1 ubiquitin carboxyl-terminal hydrolase 17-like isoform X4 [Apus apus]XP_051483435.1 ubiquitin carboxyl-terminal hydrolase 17-like isoform X9 [Apus apus]